MMQPTITQANHLLYNLHVGAAGHVALNPPVLHLGQSQTESVIHSPSGDVNLINREIRQLVLIVIHVLT